jgi:hypothetical protein
VRCRDHRQHSRSVHVVPVILACWCPAGAQSVVLLDREPLALQCALESARASGLSAAAAVGGAHPSQVRARRCCAGMRRPLRQACGHQRWADRVPHHPSPNDRHTRWGWLLHSLRQQGGACAHLLLAGCTGVVVWAFNS